MGYESTTSWIMHFTAGCSCIASLSVLLVYSCCPKVKDKTAYSIAALICFCDFFSSLGMSVGLCVDGSVQCFIQAILTNYFPLAGVFWVTVLVFSLYRIVVLPNEAYNVSILYLTNTQKQIQIDESSKVPKHNMFTPCRLLCCWGVPLVLTLLPLTTNTYGLEGDGRGWCFIKNNSNSPSWSYLFWVIFSFYFWILVSVFIYIVMISVVFSKLKHSVMSSVMQPVAKKLIYYPINIIICWGMTCIYDISMDLSDNKFIDNYIMDILTYLLPTLLGFLNALCFYVSCSDAREYLKTILTNTRDYDSKKESNTANTGNDILLQGIANGSRLSVNDPSVDFEDAFIENVFNPHILRNYRTKQRKDDEAENS